MSLRQTCIENMAEAMVPLVSVGEYNEDGLAAVALDALLSTLTEHELEWKREAAEWWSHYPEDAPRPKLADLAGLIAVLGEV